MVTSEAASQADALKLAGSVVALWRYPVKSMQGEELPALAFGPRGAAGDRAYALVDQATGKVASAKNPRKWGRLFDCRAAFMAPPAAEGAAPPVRVTLPDGKVLTSGQDDIDGALSALFGRAVTLATAPPPDPELEEYWPDIDGLAHRDAVTDEAMPAGTFFDLATVHVLTTATLDRLRALYPQGRFEVRRFRPNVVVDTVEGSGGFAEDAWVGRSLALGDEVRLRVTGPCPRCVMTTLPQSDLPRDVGILRAAAKHHDANVGVYASVVQGGTVRRGDRIQLI
ncbi:MAG TPA: MOSC domain-containing protein [Chloroflexota bacterium]|nr:MOSC domain-containing protein [Chloroflexota bacterium]